MRKRTFLPLVLILPVLAAPARAATEEPTSEAGSAKAEATAATEPQPSPSPSPEKRPSWGLAAGMGWGSAGGDFGNLLEGPVAGDFNIFRNHEKWRFGIGVELHLLQDEGPYEDEQEWGFQQTYSLRHADAAPGGVRPALPPAPRRAWLACTPAASSSPSSRRRRSPATARRHPPTDGVPRSCPGWRYHLSKSLALDLSGPLQLLQGRRTTT